jgi:NADPH-dependent 2,4-dienoyl-CoA reductase/sulfur reductase-like enzyme
VAGTALRAIAIIGAGAAGESAAESLRREGFGGEIVMFGADDSPPVDRPNLSKDYLAGEAQDDWIPLWPSEVYAQRHIELLLGSRVSSIDAGGRTVLLDNGSRRDFGALLIATGADPVRLPIPGADSTQVFYLRSFADSRAIVERARTAKHVVVVGASFIGLEVSAALRTRGVAVDVVAPDHVPLERVMGTEVGRFVQSIHEAHGVVFHLGETVTSIAGRTVTLSGGGTVDADFVVMGVGVRPATAVAERSGLAVDRGIAVNEFLETSKSGSSPPASGPMAGSAHGRAHSRGALGRGRASGARPLRAICWDAESLRRRAVFLEPALRCDDQIRGSRRALGDRDRQRFARRA